MHSAQNDKNQVYASMKKFRGQSQAVMTSKLQTPVGTYHGEDVLEGFAADSEFLGRFNETNEHFDQSFYKPCKLDYLYIFELKDNTHINIPPMNLSQLEKILHSKMKLGKSCDIYHLTVEHLRYCGRVAKLQILDLINRILMDIYFLSCPQIKLGLGTSIH